MRRRVEIPERRLAGDRQREIASAGVDERLRSIRRPLPAALHLIAVLDLVPARVLDVKDRLRRRDHQLRQPHFLGPAVGALIRSDQPAERPSPASVPGSSRMRLKKRPPGGNFPFVDRTIADGRPTRVPACRPPAPTLSPPSTSSAASGRFLTVRHAFGAPLLLRNVERFRREVPSGFGKPARRRIDRHQIDDVRANAADERLARKHPAVVRVHAPAERIDRARGRRVRDRTGTTPAPFRRRASTPPARCDSRITGDGRIFARTSLVSSTRANR